MKTFCRSHALAIALLLPCCRAATSDDVLTLGQQYVNDADYRRQVLVGSLVNPDNGYSQLRLAMYTETGWGALPEWNPAVTPTQGESTSIPDTPFQALDIDSVPWETDAIVALGQQAFSRYPVQVLEGIEMALAAPEQYGLYPSAAGAGSTVWTQLPSTPPLPAVTCATCHAMPSAEGQVIDGRPNAQLQFGAMVGADWPAGTVDVTNDPVEDPIAIADLRPVSSEQYLHHDATVRNGIIELAIRIETLIITSSQDSIRPPRKLAFALALYLWQLRPVAIREPDATSAQGEVVFDTNCARCHAPPDYSGGRVPLQEVGTDPLVGESPDRGTGTYRVPSLRGVGDRDILFASGQMSSLEEVLDPTRTQAGHQFGLSLSATDRAALLAFLQTVE